MPACPPDLSNSLKALARNLYPSLLSVKSLLLFNAELGAAAAIVVDKSEKCKKKLWDVAVVLLQRSLLFYSLKKK